MTTASGTNNATAVEARTHSRRRNDATIACDCGREVLKTSLRDHLKTLYHEKHMAEKVLQDVARKLMPPTAAQQLKPKSPYLLQHLSLQLRTGTGSSTDEG